MTIILPGVELILLFDTEFKIIFFYNFFNFIILRVLCALRGE
jgi:hypothetical protein